MDRNDEWLPAFVIGTLAVFYFLWAAMHDLAHGDEGTLETIVLVMCAAGFGLLYLLAARLLTASYLRAWLILAGALLSLFSAGAIGSLLRPKYPKDPMLGSLFLCAGLPLLALIGGHLARIRRGRRATV